MSSFRASSPPNSILSLALSLLELTELFVVASSLGLSSFDIRLSYRSSSRKEGLSDVGKIGLVMTF